jgi:hypothetical protein
MKRNVCPKLDAREKKCVHQMLYLKVTYRWGTLMLWIPMLKGVRQ